MGQRTMVVNGRSMAAPDTMTVRELRQRAGVGESRALAEVEDAGTMRRLSEGEVLGPESTGVYTSLPDFRYGS